MQENKSFFLNTVYSVSQNNRTATINIT